MKIGKGGFATVYKCLCNDLPSDYRAIKIFDNEGNSFFENVIYYLEEMNNINALATNDNIL